MKFQYADYDNFFNELLCEKGEDISKYASLFDLREPPKIKGRIQNQKRKQIWNELEKKHGRVCQLQLIDTCDINNPTEIDHIIPLSSNELNKIFRTPKSLIAGKKVPTESFGSNNISNLVLACSKCNSNKKHRFLDRAQIRRILRLKGF